MDPIIFNGTNSLPDCTWTMSPLENPGPLIAGNGYLTEGINIPRGSCPNVSFHENIKLDEFSERGTVFMDKLSGLFRLCGSVAQ